MKNKYSPLFEEAGEGSPGGSAPVESTGSLSPTQTTSLSESGTGSGPPADFHSALSVSDEIRQWDGFKNVKNSSDAVTQLYNAQRMIGVEKIAKPQEGWTDDQWNQHYTDLGRPAESKAYIFPELSEDNSGLFNSEAVDGFKDVFHKLGLDQKQAEGIMQAYYDSSIGGHETALAERTEKSNLAMQEIVSEFGDQYEGKMHLAQKAVQEVGLTDTLRELGVDTDPRMIRAFVKIGETMLESTPVDGVPSFNVGGVAQAQHSIEQFKGNQEKLLALHNNQNPGHEAAKSEWTRLHEEAYPVGS